MAVTFRSGILFVGALTLGASCSSSEMPDPGPVDTGPQGPVDSGMNGPTLYERLGEEAGITTVVNDFVGRLVTDPAINGYFLNSSFDGGRFGKCLVKQLGDLTGGPQQYPAEGDNAPDADGCRNMTEAHKALGVSGQDFGDVAGHLIAALQAAEVVAADVDAITRIITDPAFVTPIVNDASSNATIYQRVGRKPAIASVVAEFVALVLADPAINGYFLNASLDPARFSTCLVRQICGLSEGPCKYGEGVEDQLNGVACKSMSLTHTNMGISTQDYGDLVAHLVTALSQGGVMQADIDVIAAALSAPAFIADIVEDAAGDATIYQRLGRKPAINNVIGDFVTRVSSDPAINGYFTNNTLDPARLGTCLIRQVCDVTGGPCVYGAGTDPELNGTVCRDMLSLHAGMGISAQDFGDLAAHLVGALTDAGVAQPDIDAIVAVVTAPAFVANIVEDPDSNATVYQRVGRRSAIGEVVSDFAGRVLGDPEINGFFTMTDAVRLSTCLTRQVCAIDGPCRYGQGTEPELGGTPCRDMLSLHAGMVDTGGSGITISDFNALAGHLALALDAAGVQTSDRDAIIGAIAPLCGDIIADPTQCPM